MSYSYYNSYFRFLFILSLTRKGYHEHEKSYASFKLKWIRYIVLLGGITGKCWAPLILTNFLIWNNQQSKFLEVQLHTYAFQQ